MRIVQGPALAPVPAAAALLRGPGVTWEAVGADRARVTVRHQGLERAVDMRADEAGRPVEVVVPRGSDANPDAADQLQPFGGRMPGFRELGGYRLPFHVEAGDMYRAEDHFAVFLADATAIPGAGVAP